MKLRMIAIAGVCMTGLAACGSANSSSTAANTTTTTTSHPAAASNPPATAAAAPVTTPASLPPTTAPAITPTTASASAGSAKTVTLWCGTGTVYAYPSVSEWAGAVGDNVIDAIKRTTAYIESAQQVQANPWAGYALQLCGEVVSADGSPPPADQSTWAAAMSDFLRASAVLHSAPEASTVSTARPYLNSGTTELDTFMAANGIPADI